jgi:hypothetical protein
MARSAALLMQADLLLAFWAAAIARLFPFFGMGSKRHEFPFQALASYPVESECVIKKQGAGLPHFLRC